MNSNNNTRKILLTRYGKKSFLNQKNKTESCIHLLNTPKIQCLPLKLLLNKRAIIFEQILTSTAMR